MQSVPTPAEIAAAPIIDRWRVIEHHPFRQVWGYFTGHPELADGSYGHSSPLIEIEDSAAPSWAICRKRIYRLAHPLSEAEAEIREIATSYGITAERVKLDELADKWAELSGESGQADEVEQLLINMMRRKLIEGHKAHELLSAYVQANDEGDRG